MCYPRESLREQPHSTLENIALYTILTSSGGCFWNYWFVMTVPYVCMVILPSASEE